MWQKCPTCNGTGIAMTPTCSHGHCPTCNGWRIISELDGLPPAITNSTQSTISVTNLKGTDFRDKPITSSKTEISDEEIKEAAKDYHWKNGVYYAQEKTFIDAIKWYREQIKSI